MGQSISRSRGKTKFQRAAKAVVLLNGSKPATRAGLGEYWGCFSEPCCLKVVNVTH